MEFQKWKIFRHLDPIFAADVKRAYLVGIDSSADDDHGNPAEKKKTPCGGVMVMKNDDVYFITRNFKELQLSAVQEREDSLPLVPTRIDALCGQRLRAISSGCHHVVALTMEGRIYQWGRIWVEQKSCRHLIPEFVKGGGIENKRVIQIACGQNHSLALTSDGDVFSWGSNRSGQLGTGRATFEMAPCKISGLNGFDAKIAAIACAGWISFALDEQRKVWSWGTNVGNALGYESPAPRKIPGRIPGLENIKMIAAGDTHALALSHKRQLYFWGQHTLEYSAVSPELVEVPNNVAGMGAIRGCSVSALKTTKGKVYYWGWAYGHDVADPVLTRFDTVKELFASLDSPMMLEPVTSELKQPIAEKLKLSFDDRETGDVRFKFFGERMIFAHTAFLKLRSDHFRRMFDHNWKDNDEKEVQVTEFGYDCFRTFLFYLYTDRIDPPARTAEDAIELFKLADYYGEEDLKQRCEQQLKVLMTDGNVSKVYTISLQYSAQALREIALDFLIPNLNTVVTTEEYRKMPDDSKARLMQELADEQVLVGLKRKRKK